MPTMARSLRLVAEACSLGGGSAWPLGWIRLRCAPWTSNLERPVPIAVLAIAGAISTAIVIAVAMTATRQVDFDVYRMGGLHVFGPDLYAVRLHFLHRGPEFTYTPFAALLFWPMGRVAESGGQVLWAFVNFVLPSSG